MVKKKRTCFLIDDDIDDQEIFEMALQAVDKNIHFSSALDGIEALQKLLNSSFVPDYIFLDINMPKMNGIQCLSEIRKLQHLQRSRVIMYSTSSNEAVKTTSRQLGADEFLVKPTKMAQLVTLLTQVLEK